MPSTDGEARPTRHPERFGLRFTIEPTWCVRRNGAACRACESACPHGAVVTLDDGAVPCVDAARCTDCGVCQGVCDAFASTRRTLADAAKRALGASAHGDVAYVACEELLPEGAEPAANTVVMPCLAAGCAEFWTLALTADAPVVAVCDFARCSACAKAGPEALELFSQAIGRAEELTGRTVGMAEEAPVAMTLAQDYGRNEDFDRRGLLRKLAVDAAEAANGTRRVKTSSVLQDFRARQERLHATARLRGPDDGPFKDFAAEIRARRLVPPRRRMLEAAGERLPRIAERLDAEGA